MEKEEESHLILECTKLVSSIESPPPETDRGKLPGADALVGLTVTSLECNAYVSLVSLRGCRDG